MSSATDSQDQKVPLNDILKWSLSKLTVTRRAKNGTNLRNSLLVTHLILKTRNAIMEQRTQEFVRQKLDRQRLLIKSPPRKSEEICSQDSTDQLVLETVEKSIYDLEDHTLPSSNQNTETVVESKTEQSNTQQHVSRKSDPSLSSLKRKRPQSLDISSLHITSTTTTASSPSRPERAHSPSKRSKEKENQEESALQSNHFEVPSSLLPPSKLSAAYQLFGSTPMLFISSAVNNFDKNREPLVYLDLSNTHSSCSSDLSYMYNQSIFVSSSATTDVHSPAYSAASSGDYDVVVSGSASVGSTAHVSPPSLSCSLVTVSAV